MRSVFPTPQGCLVRLGEAGYKWKFTGSLTDDYFATDQFFRRFWKQSHLKLNPRWSRRCFSLCGTIPSEQLRSRYFRMDGIHLLPEGSRRVAEVLFRCFEEAGLFEEVLR